MVKPLYYVVKQNFSSAPHDFFATALYWPLTLFDLKVSLYLHGNSTSVDSFDFHEQPFKQENQPVELRCYTVYRLKLKM